MADQRTLIDLSKVTWDTLLDHESYAGRMYGSYIDMPSDVPWMPFVGYHMCFRHVRNDPLGWGATKRLSNRLAFVTLAEDLPGFVDVGGTWLLIEPRSRAEVALKHALVVLHAQGGVLDIEDFTDRQRDVLTEKIHRHLTVSLHEYNEDAAYYIVDRLERHHDIWALASGKVALPTFDIAKAYSAWKQHMARRDHYEREVIDLIGDFD